MPETGNVKLTTNDSKAYHNIGAVYVDANGAKFIYVKFDNGSGNVVAAAGKPVGWLASFLSGKVTTDLSDTSLNQIAGILQAALTDQYFGWIQVSGKGRVALTTDGNIADNSKFVWSADNTVAPFTDPGNEEAIFGTATAADTGTALAAGDYWLSTLGF